MKKGLVHPELCDGCFGGRGRVASNGTGVGGDPSVKGLNFFSPPDHQLLRTLQRGEFNIHGWRRADLLRRLDMTPSAMSRQLRRLRLLGLIKKVSHTYRYYLTRLGRAAIAAAGDVGTPHATSTGVNAPRTATGAAFA